MTVLAPTGYWACPSCRLVEEAQIGLGQARMHPCPALNGMAVPLSPVDRPDDTPDTRHVVVLAEDYIGGRKSPITAVRTDRPDGSNDLNVYPEAAVAVTSI